MEHTLRYIIESDDDIVIRYVQLSYTPEVQPEWVYGVNDFDSIEDVDPENVDSPDIVRIHNDEEYDYYVKTLIVPYETTNFRICVVIDGVEGNGSFICENNSGFVTTKRVGSEIYTTVDINKTRTDRNTTVTINYRSDESINATVTVQQKPCDITLKMTSCEVDDGEEIYDILLNSDKFEYTFKPLTDKYSKKKQKLTFTMDVHGLTRTFYVKNIIKYSEIGEIDNTYKIINGEFYKRRQKLVNGEFVSYYDKAVVINNIGFQLTPYDDAFYVEKNGNKVSFTNYGRVFMEENAFYVITLANNDDIDVTCKITLHYSTTSDIQ